MVTGIDESRIAVQKIELAKMRDSGLLVNLDVHGISLFSIRTAFSELGIGNDDVRTSRMHAGAKDLFPAYSRKFRSLEARARQNFADYTFKVAALGDYFWLPFTAYDSFQERHAEIVAEWETTKEHLLAAYDQIVQDNIVFFSAAAERAWRGLLSQYPDGKVMIVVDKMEAFSHDEKDRFVEYIVSKAMARTPTPADISLGVWLDYRTAILYTEREVMEELAAEEIAKAEIAKAQRSVSWLDLEKAEKAARIESIRQAELEHARQQLASMGSPLQEALDALKANVYSAVKTLLGGLKTNDGFKGRASSKAAELYSYWQRLNGGLLQDAELDSALKTLESSMKAYQSSEGEGRKAHVGEIISQLSEIATLTVQSAETVRRGADRAAHLDLDLGV
jgi:hypothetical protein